MHGRQAPCQLNYTLSAVISSQMCSLKFTTLVSIAMTERTPWPKSRVGRKGLGLGFHITVTTDESQGRNRAGTWRQGLT